MLGRHWTPVGDWAVAELILRHMPSTLPLSGAYSMMRGYNHPLPWMYYIEWLPYRLSGDRSAAELATLVWWNGACLALLAWLLARRRALTLAAIAIPLALVMASRGDTATLILPWNPYFALLPAFVLVFAAWRFAVGDTELLPLVVALALLASGMHLAYLPSAVAVVAVAVVWHVCTRRGRSNAPWRRPAVITACVALVVLAPVLIDLVVHGRASNPWQIASHLVHPSNHIPPSQIFQLLRAELAIPPTWLSGRVAFSVYAYQPQRAVPVVGPGRGARGGACCPPACTRRARIDRDCVGGARRRHPRAAARRRHLVGGLVRADDARRRRDRVRRACVVGAPHDQALHTPASSTDRAPCRCRGPDRRDVDNPHGAASTCRHG